MTVTVGRHGLVIDGREEVLFSGEVHPWRLNPDDWGPVLDTIASLGFRAVCFYVSWARHEVAPGEYDFTGALDIERFLGMVHERGMRAVVRVGPDTAAEQEDSGYPRRILEDPAMMARRPSFEPYLLLSSTGHCFPPSYLSREFLAEVARWYDEIIPRLARLQHPDGPIVLCQVDNEMGYHFQSNTYALDYALGAATQLRNYDANPDVDPPVDADDWEHEDVKLAWVEWKERHLRSTLAQLGTWVRERGMDRVPLLHNDYPRTTTPQDLGALEQSGAVDIAAADIYTTKEGGRFVRDLARHLAGSSRLPFLAELGAGWLALPWLLPLSVSSADEEVNGLRAFAAGVKAANVYMLVDRDRWYGSPVSETGVATEAAKAMYPRLLRLVDDVHGAGLERHVRVLLVENRAETRLVATRDTLGDAVPSFSQLLPIDHRLTSVPDPHTDLVRRWERELPAVVDREGVDWDHASSSSLPDLTRYDVVIVPCFGRMEKAVWPTLVAAAANGVTVLVGPDGPVKDERGRNTDFALDGDVSVVRVTMDKPYYRVGDVPGPRPGRSPFSESSEESAPPVMTSAHDATAESVEDSVPTVRRIASAEDVVAHLPRPLYRVLGDAAPHVDLHVWRGGGRTVLFAASASSEPLTFAIDVAHDGHEGHRRRFTGLWHDEVLDTDDAGPRAGTVTATLAPWSVQVWEVEVVTS